MQIIKATVVSEGKAADLMFDGFRGIMRGGQGNYPVRGGFTVTVTPLMEGVYMVKLMDGVKVIACTTADNFDL